MNKKEQKIVSISLDTSKGCPFCGEKPKFFNRSCLGYYDESILKCPNKKCFFNEVEKLKCDNDDQRFPKVKREMKGKLRLIELWNKRK